MKPGLMVGAALCALLVGIGGFFLFHKGPNVPAPPSSATTTPVANSGESVSEASVPPGSVLYRNVAYAFSLAYPKDLQVHEYDERGTHTITFQNATAGQGFQIFIVPYTESTISDARFKEDVPSGVRTQVEATALDGVAAVAFVSRDALLGETREVWLIHGGYLYEITTLRPLESWLNAILLTWHFL